MKSILVRCSAIGPCFLFRGLGLEPIDKVDDVAKPASGAGSDTVPGDGDGEMVWHEKIGS
jgi:hypothetical protein